MRKSNFRRERITRPIYDWAREVLPELSQTEKEALNAGDVWWDAALFSGNPNWETLLQVDEPSLTDEEQAFLDGPVEELCRMVDEWRVTWEDGDLPADVWTFLKREKFFAMIIPKTYGGLEFSAYAHSQIIRKISSRSLTAAVTVMVPNSLGPGELLIQFGTEAQKDYWLPRLADGREIPCFGLTSPEAGSDAASMIDHGEVCRREDGSLGIRLNWHKRYITLGPVATVQGLAFKLYDSEGLLGDEKELGITLALVPTDLDGVEIGRRHLPSFQMFQNGPNRGRNVVIPLENVIGGEELIGKGWALLMSALAAGRGISLPSLSAAATAFAVGTAGAYARVREQFGAPIGDFEGIQAPLARLAATAYLLDAARRLTCAGLDEGRKLAVISAIMKAHATDRMRMAINDAMDIHGGKTVIDGPSNYLGNLYRAVPVAITVEGANIVTRNLIIFGQGAVRCHPWLLEEMKALQINDEEESLAAFDRAFWRHVAHGAKTIARAWLRSWSGGRLGPAPKVGNVRHHYRRLSRYSAAFALISEIALLTLGGALKRKEMLSARFGDILSELYLLSGALKRWQGEGRQSADLALVDHCMLSGSARIERRMDEILANLPNRPAAWLVRAIVLPLGVRSRGPSDELMQRCAKLVLEPSETRARLLEGLFLGDEHEAVGQLEEAFRLALESAPLRSRLREQGFDDWHDARDEGRLDASEAALLDRLDRAVATVVAVDDFDPHVLGQRRRVAEAAQRRTTGNGGEASMAGNDVAATPR